MTPWEEIKSLIVKGHRLRCDEWAGIPASPATDDTAAIAGSPGTYSVFVVIDGDRYQCVLYRGLVPEYWHFSQQQNDTWLADFEANYKAKANGTAPKSSDGRPILAPTFEDAYGLTPIWDGQLCEAAPGAISIFDKLITTELKIRGGWYELLEAGAVVGDLLEFAIVDKDDVLGYFTPLGLTVGSGVLELKKYVRNEYVAPAALAQRQEFFCGSVFSVMAGLYFRTIYHSTGTTPVKFKTMVFAYE